MLLDPYFKPQFSFMGHSAKPEKIKGRKRTTGNGDINIETPESNQSPLSLVVKQSTL